MISLVKADYGLTSTSNTAFTVTKGTGNETFVYTGTTNQTATAADNPWHTIKSTSAQRFTQASESGSVINKWHITNITVNYSKVTSTTGQHNYVTLAATSTALFDYISVTNSTSLTNLNLNATVASVDLDYDLGITTFSIACTYNVYISQISLTYTIDYGSC